MKILVADDDANSRQLLHQTLKSAGYEITEVADGESALSILNNEGGPRIALLDWIMPGMDGTEVCQAVRSRRDQPYVYLILLSQKQGKSDVVAGLESGADDYLAKPFHPEELHARLRTGQRILKLQDKLVDAREQMWFKATHDGLTSLWNRGFVLDLLERELARARRESSSLALLMCDLDHFKEVNDRRGHLAGDEVLREIARRLLGSVRVYDTVGRYGGEEFIIILHGCDGLRGRNRAEQIRRIVEKKPVTTGRGTVSITISIGVVSSRDYPGMTVEQLLHEGDAALYRAKAEGRNRVILVPPENAAAPLEIEMERTRQD